MPRRPEIGNIQLYPLRPLTQRDKNGFVLKFYCPIHQTRIRKNCGTRDRREARRIQRECRERLLNGEYIASGGAITANHSPTILPPPRTIPAAPQADGMSWQEAYDRYREQRSTRVRENSLVHALSRLGIAEKILEGYRQDLGLPEGLAVTNVMTLDGLEYLQERLVAGDEARYDTRSPNTVNSMMGAVMAFVRFCHKRGWIPSVPPVEKLDVDDVMKGRPITGEEFERMLETTPKVVGEEAAESWQFALRILWESGFRIGDLMDFTWDDPRHIHPVWPQRSGDHPTLVIPSSQKNGRLQEIPMLPGLRTLLDEVPSRERVGWVSDPRPIQRGETRPGMRSHGRMTKERVGRVIAMIGKESRIVVRPADDRTGQREKFASAHDLRRGCALRLINAGISAETLRILLRHSTFATTEKFYGAIRSAQSAAAEVYSTLSTENPSFVGGFTGGNVNSPPLTEEQISVLKSLLNSL
ncbi:MAG: tyrosine-type recombinase/integrase [Planctomycetaceae bacterium]